MSGCGIRVPPRNFTKPNLKECDAFSIASKQVFNDFLAAERVCKVEGGHNGGMAFSPHFGVWGRGASPPRPRNVRRSFFALRMAIATLSILCFHHDVLPSSLTTFATPGPPQIPLNECASDFRQIVSVGKLLLQGQRAHRSNQFLNWSASGAFLVGSQGEYLGLTGHESWT